MVFMGKTSGAGNKDLKLIIFDMEGVIVSSWVNFYKFLPKAKLTPEIIKQINLLEVRRKMYLGTATEDEFVSQAIKEFRINATPEEMKTAIRMALVEIPGMRYILTELRKKYKLALLSSTAKEWVEYLDSRYSIKALFDAVFISGHTGLRKPDPAAYKQVLQHFSVAAENSLFIDDNEKNTQGAATLGIKTILTKSAVQLFNALKSEYKINFDPSPYMFRSYDIRGIFNLDLTSEVARDLGSAFGTYIGTGKTVYVARDYRNGGAELESSFIEGVTSVGTNIVDLGILPTPVYYFALMTNAADGGVMITASHNPPEWEGFKLSKDKGKTIGEGFGMEELKKIFMTKAFKTSPAPGSVSKKETVREEYIKYVISRAKLERKLKVVLDPGNGAWSGISSEIFRKLGCEVFEINGNPDPLFSGRGPNPTDDALAGLRNAVKERGADLGCGLDGDGDRVSFVDDKGKIVGSGGIVVSIFASSYCKSTPGAKIVYDMPCSMAVEEVVESLGGKAIPCRTGHVYMMAAMAKEGAIFGGEYSNHLYFAENFNLDDGCFAAIKMAEIVANGSLPLSKLAASMISYPSIPIEELYCPDDIKLEVVEETKPQFKKMGFRVVEVDGIKLFNDRGCVLVRVSNTMPQIKINSEGKTPEDAEKLFSLAKNIVLEKINEHIHTNKTV
jgi:phosphomannomutase/phosphoglucomutase